MNCNLKRVAAILIFCTNVIHCFADEGMWLPNLLEKQIYSSMLNAGCKLTPEDIYSINQTCLKDAVILFGGGCSGVVVSDKGLLMTNFHCSEYFVQKISSSERNYIKDGFWAKSFSEEMPMKGLSIEILESMTDVTDKILANISDTFSIAEKKELISKNSKNLIKEISENDSTDFVYSVESFFYDNQFFLFKSKIYRDIRLVASPPALVGSFGFDTDNWEWPRHRADFTVFRIYSDSLNKPSEFAATNIPFKPKYSVEIALENSKENDFAMIMGYPGKTEQYIPLKAVVNNVNVINEECIKLRKIRLDAIRKYSSNNEEVYLKYYSKDASISNYHKKLIGEQKGFEKSNLYNIKTETEAEFLSWVNSSDSLKTKYGLLLPALHSKYLQFHSENIRLRRFYEGIYNTEIVQICKITQRLLKLSTIKEYENQFSESVKSIQLFFDNYVKEIDYETTLNLFSENDKSIHEDVLLSVLIGDIIQKNDISSYISQVYSQSILLNKRLLLSALEEIKSEMMENEKSKKIKTVAYNKLINDIGYKLGIFLIDYFSTELYPSYVQLNNQVDSVQSIYMNAYIDYRNQQSIYPDANGTLRVTFGNIRGYSPRDGVDYDYYSTANGIFQKVDQQNENRDYFAPNDFLNLLHNNSGIEFYSDSIIRTCFTTTCHTSGGNSGSPVFNAHGQLIGLNFDRSWEGTISDFKYDKNFCRSIAVDIRYILYILKYYGKTEYLFDEFKFD
ncbi:MAG: S46 family peptidase [Bacteroidales bacterium]|nr:S46 family peptidase [Bacteroidales bacterium]